MKVFNNSKLFIESADGNRQPYINQVAVYWEEVDCTDIYSANGFDEEEFSHPATFTYGPTEGETR